MPSPRLSSFLKDTLLADHESGEEGEPVHAFEHAAIDELDAKAGTWMLTTLHIVRADSHDHAEWESYWASNTFPIWD